MILHRVLVALVAGCGLTLVAPAQAYDVGSGRVVRGDGVLKPGCRDYGFRYVVHPGPRDWGAEFFLIGPGGEGLGTVVKLSNTAGKRGRGHYEVCRPATRPGKFRIRGKLTISDGSDQTVRWVKPARFRLRRS